uniref:Uncharacterized protein n=1 Tax=Alexandrium monilatum TaxID=311494 RepID=A0A7S4SD86_9DINO
MARRTKAPRATKPVGGPSAMATETAADFPESAAASTTETEASELVESAEVAVANEVVEAQVDEVASGAEDLPPVTEIVPEAEAAKPAEAKEDKVVAETAAGVEESAATADVIPEAEAAAGVELAAAADTVEAEAAKPVEFEEVEVVPEAEEAAEMPETPHATAEFVQEPAPAVAPEEVAEGHPVEGSEAALLPAAFPAADQGIVGGSPAREMAPLKTLATATVAAQAAQAAKAAIAAAPAQPMGAISPRERFMHLWAAATGRIGRLSAAAETAVCAADEQANMRVPGTVDFARDKAAVAVDMAHARLASLMSTTAEAKVWAGSTASGAARHARERAMSLASTAVERCGEAKRIAVGHAAAAASAAQAKALEVRTGVCNVAADERFQVSVASAASGALVLGASGGAVGLTTGSVVGAAIGFVPAPFTFGLSIPISAAIGGTAGLTIGTAVGGTVGAVSGGAVGYGVYTKKEDIGRCARRCVDGAVDAAEFSKAQACASAGYVLDTASAARSRLGVSGTGGTEALV